MLARIVSVNFEQGKWRFTDGTNSFWASVEDEEFLSRVDSRDVSFAKGDTLRIRYFIRQDLRAGRLSSEYIITKVLDLQPAPKQIKLF